MYIRRRTRQKIRYSIPFVLLALVVLAAGGYAVWLCTNEGSFYEEPDPVCFQTAQMDSAIIEVDSTIEKRSLYRKQKEDVHIDLSKPDDYISLKDWIIIQWNSFKAARAEQDSVR